MYLHNCNLLECYWYVCVSIMVLNLLFTIGGLCEVECLSGKSCRKFGQFICLCKQRKKGTDCKEKGVIFVFLLLWGFYGTLIMNSTNLSKQLIHKYTVLVYTYVCQSKSSKPEIACFNVKFVWHNWIWCPVLCYMYALYYPN